MNGSRQGHGYTITELMLVLAITALLLALGAPGLRGLLQRQRLATAAGDLLAAVHLTRSEAIRRGERVDLVPAGDGGDWSRGWVVLVDRNGNQKADAGEQIIFSHGPIADGITIKASFTDSKVQYLAYNPSGHSRTNTGSQSPQFGNWLLSADQQQRKIVINILGRPRTCNPELERATC